MGLFFSKNTIDRAEYRLRAKFIHIGLWITFPLLVTILDSPVFVIHIFLCARTAATMVEL